jgi:hypothetical protein
MSVMNCLPMTSSVPYVVCADPKDQKKVSCGFDSPQLTLRG